MYDKKILVCNLKNTKYTLHKILIRTNLGTIYIIRKHLQTP